MFKIRVLNPHGLKVVKVWPTLRAVGLSFHDVEALIKGRALRLPPLAAGIVAELLNEQGYLTERLQS